MAEVGSEARKRDRRRMVGLVVVARGEKLLRRNDSKATREGVAVNGAAEHGGGGGQPQAGVAEATREA